MRTILLIFNLFVCHFLFAQKDSHISVDSSQQDLAVNEISLMEQKSHEKHIENLDLTSLTSASTNFDIKYYRIELDVDPAVNYVTGKVTAYYVMTTGGNSISFDLVNNHTVSNVLQRGVPLTKSHTNNTLQINFPATVNAGVLDSVSIFYQGAPPSSGFGSFILSTHGNPAIPTMWSLSEPYGSRDWWPCKNGLNDKADNGVDIMITHPETYQGQAYKAAANGILKSEVQIANGKLRAHWKHTYPIASYLVCFAVTNYTVFNRSVLINSVNIPMVTYCYPENVTTWQNGTQNTLDALQYFSKEFGTYPFVNEKYGHVQFGWGGGMEHQSNSFMVNLSESLVVHELGHQWFGDKVTCGSWEDIWLNEGFATHLASMYMENKYNSPATIRQTRSNEITQITNSAGGSVWVDDTTSVNRIFSNRLSYTKGSHLLYMLRWILTDDVFFKGVRNYLNDPAHAYGFARTANLKAHLEAVSKEDLTYFFDQWFRGQGYPSYQLTWFPVGNSVQFNLKQTTSHASVSFFKLPVPIRFRNNTLNLEKIIEADNTFNDQNFVANLGFVAETVTVDPEFWLITRGNTVTKSSNPLPVTFTYINTNCKSNGVEISWGTSSEENAERFDIQKSKDAVKWEQIGTVDAAGNSSQLKTYKFVDQNISAQKAYYRIAEKDYDGKMQYTRIFQKDCSDLQEFEWKISPNPVQDKLTIWPPAKTNVPYSIVIYDLNGKLVSSRNGLKSNVENQINVSGLEMGLYILKLNFDDGSTSKTLKFIKR